jgi:transposase InsO family protein
VAIDVFSRFAHTFPLRSTRGKEMSSALQTLFRRGKKPTNLKTDKGVEFGNRDVQRLLKAERVDHFYTQNEQKSCYDERCIKTLKSKLFRYLSRHQTHRWIDILDEITQSYNEIIIVPSRWLHER